MPAALLSRDEVVERLMRVVRRRGYDGASLAELSKATGLGRSSLYHHFPDGKDDMVRAVLSQLERELRETVFYPLRQRGPARQRVDNMVKTLDTYYRGGATRAFSAILCSERAERVFGRNSVRSSTNGSTRSPLHLPTVDIPKQLRAGGRKTL